MDDDGGAGVDYATIQAAVDVASVGDTIEVRSRTYIENSDLEKRLLLEGADVGDGAGGEFEDLYFSEMAGEAKNSI